MKKRRCNQCGSTIPSDWKDKDTCEGCLAEALDRYTDPTNPEYDPEFTAELKRVRPEWLNAPRDPSHN